MVKYQKFLGSQDKHDFISEEEPVKESELHDGEFIKQMTMTALMIVLEKQNEIL